jgi:hypothetical protein
MDTLWCGPTRANNATVGVFANMTLIIATDHASFAVSGLEHSIGFFRDVLPKGRVIMVDQEPNQGPGWSTCLILAALLLSLLKSPLRSLCGS